MPFFTSSQFLLLQKLTPSPPKFCGGRGAFTKYNYPLIGIRSLPHENLNVKRKFSNEQLTQLVGDTIPLDQKSVKNFFVKIYALVNCNSYCENIQFKTPELLFVTSKTNSFGVL